jgi:hypothetical protein
MQALPMDIPAEIHRWVEDGSDVTVAKGPLVIMAHGLMSIDPAERCQFWIHSALGDLSPQQIEEALRRWSTAH